MCKRKPDYRGCGRSEQMRLFVLFLIIFAAVGCGPSTFATMLVHPETGDTQVCRSGSLISMSHMTKAAKFSEGREVHDECVRQLTHLGYEIHSRSESVKAD